VLVISVVNQKGGVGKTTIATHLAKYFHLRGKNVVLVDSDPQGSARNWGEKDVGQTVEVIAIDRPTHKRDLRAYTHYDFVIIDGAPQVHALALSAISVSDFVLIPVSPSPLDLWSTETLAEIVKDHVSSDPDRLRAAFVINRCAKNTKLAKAIREPLEALGLPILATQLNNRVAYPTAATNGQTVMDTEPNGEAASEISLLVDEIISLLPKT
jgi:chromosome partitioning protein